MRIDQLTLVNFKLFEQLTLDLHPQFTLLIGENGSGKTSLLDALAVACGVWLMDVPDGKIQNNQRPLHDSDIRLTPSFVGDRTTFTPALHVSVDAQGELVAGQQSRWSREILSGKKTLNLSHARDLIKTLYEQSSNGQSVILPVIAYYRAGRAWLTHRDRTNKLTPNAAPLARWSAFYDCLNERIRFKDLQHWFWNEETARGQRQGRYRPGFEVVRRALLRCIPNTDGIWFDPDVADIVLSMNSVAQPSSNLSAGQRMMLALVADIATKMVTQNNFLVPRDELSGDESVLPEVLEKTPGVVLIDELDVHLHPRWQRRVVRDLQSTFPRIQFVCTTHSPQIIGETPPEQTRVLQASGVTNIPPQTIGLDSNTVLEEVMDAESQTAHTETLLKSVDDALEVGDLHLAKQVVEQLREFQRGTTPTTAELEAIIATMEVMADAED